MSRTKCCATAIVAMVLFLIPSFANGDIIVTISDDGTDLTMTATGTYDVSSLTPVSDVGLGANAVVAPPLDGGAYGWDVGGGSDSYAISFDGVLSGTGFAFPATSVSTNTPFVFAGNNILFVGGTSSTGTVNELAVFENTTLASLGMIEGESITATWGTGGEGEGATILVGEVSAVPEPSTLLILGLGTAALAFQRRRLA